MRRAVKPGHQTTVVEYVLAVRQSSDYDSLVEGLHADDALRCAELIYFFVSFDELDLGYQLVVFCDQICVLSHCVLLAELVLTGHL